MPIFNVSENVIHKNILNAKVCQKTYLQYSSLIYTHTHLHKGGKGVTIPSKLVTETDHCLKQSTLSCSTKIQNKRNQY